jgi:nitroreductase/Pyruvate/2-oxoacid:ferredoxin oxidoreductase delta subunit
VIERTVSTVIDPDLCIGCGECVRVCPSGTIEMREWKAEVTGERSLGCGHCAAVCPVEAVRVAAVDPDSLRFRTFSCRPEWQPHGAFDTAGLVGLMASRRSCRNYDETPVPRAVLEDLVKIGATAPSGTNSQRWSFTVLPSRAAVMALGDGVAGFFKRLNRLAENALLRGSLRLCGKKELSDYYRDYHQSVQEGLAEWEQHGRDRLFHGATAAILVGSRPGASCPAEDALLATQNILLAAHAMGLGSCLVGFAVSAMEKAPGIKTALGIPAAERIHAVIALGHPAETYLRLAGRKKAVLRFFEPPAGDASPKREG